MRRATGVLVVAMVLAVAGGSLAAGAAAHGRGSTTSPWPPAMAAYEWNQAGDLSPATVHRRLRFLRGHGFRTVYLEVGRLVDAGDQRPSRRRTAELDRIRGQIRGFVATAARFGLAVHALGGGPDWVGDDRGYLGQLLVELVGSYNAKVRPHERLRGVQLDIEPYTQQDWFANPDLIRVYLATLDGIVRTYRRVLAWPGNGWLQLGFAIPFWLDGQEEAPPEVVFKGREKPAAFHIIDLLRNLPGAYLVIMSYRDHAEEPDGSIGHALHEFDYAAARSAKCGLVVGQQYGRDPSVEEGTDTDSKLTFFEESREEFWQEAAEITEAFQGYRQFRGLALDGIDDYMAAPDAAAPGS